MAMGASPNRRKIKSPVEPVRRVPGCDSQPPSTSTDRAGSHGSLGQSINQALQLPGGKKVKAFVLMALHDDGDVSTHTTNHVQQCTNQVFTSDAEDLLRLAHRKSVFGTPSEQQYQEHDLVSPSRFRANSPQSNRHYQDFDSISRTRPNPNEHSTSEKFKEHTHVNNERSNSGNNGLLDMTRDAPLVKPSSTNPQVELQSMLVCESSKIELFLARRLRRMQQLAVKRIAKAWIKGICPKKQAIYPYHKKKREREGRNHSSSDIPAWWPPISECRFVEPDHIKRDERIKLCLHLLRLRPDPEVLKEWNGGSAEPDQTHLTKGWTEFLMELAPPSIFDKLKEPGDKTQQRRKLLAQIYDLARREEDYQMGDIDGNDRFWYEVSSEDKPQKKKLRRSSELSDDESDTESTANSARFSKKAKVASEITTPAKSPTVAHYGDSGFDYNMQDCKPVISNNVQNNIPPVNEAYTTSPVQPSWEHYQFNADSKPQNPLRSMHENSHSNQSGPSVPQPYVVQASWDERSSPASFSASVASGNQSVADAFSLERPDYHFPQTALSQAPGVAGCPVYMAGQFLRPQFEDAQSNTACTPVDLSTSPRSHAQSSVQQHYNQAIYHVQPGNAPPGMFAPDANMQVPVDTEASFRPGVAAHQNQASYSVHPTSCYQQSETGQIVFSYPEFRPGTEFQAPARIERGFTGHGSGVGGGAFT